MTSRFGALTLIGLGGLFSGVTGPLLSTFIPPLVGEVLGDRRTAIGAVMAIDNALLLLLVPLTGPLSDRLVAHGHGRMRLVIAGFILAAIGMAVLPMTTGLGLAALIGAMIVMNSGINLQRSPFQALLADLVPSRDRSLATGSVTFQMCVGAIVFLMLGRALGMRTAFLIGAGTILVIAAAFAAWIHEPPMRTVSDEDVSFSGLGSAAWAALGGAVPGMRAIFVAALLVQLTFQTFTTWFALHGTERFGVRPEDVTIGFIAWAVGGVIGSLPAGFVGTRFGRRNGMIVGFILMLGSLLALDRTTTLMQSVPLLVLASAAWTFPMVNAFPLFVEPVPRQHRGMLAALYLLTIALGGMIGDPLNGFMFDLADSYRGLFLVMSAYTALALVAVMFVPRGVGESTVGNGG